MSARTSKALLVSAAASNQGKTTISAALAYHHRKQGKKVRVFKSGPDFLDPMILEFASGHPVFNLDLWMVGEKDCRQLLYKAAAESDLIIVEGVMGLFDGTPSSADIAELFGIPILAIIDASSMAQTFHALAHGLTSFRPSLKFAGVIANNLASERHAAMISEGASDLYVGGLFRSTSVSLPHRHLGLFQASEISDLEQRLAAAAQSLEAIGATNLAKDVSFAEEKQAVKGRPLAGAKIKIARDNAFCFIYPANVKLLEELGATVSFFSPLNNEVVDDADSIYLPGGYPELYLDSLESNTRTKASITKHFEAGKPIYAECGGMLYLLDSLTDKAGKTKKFLGLLAGNAVMQDRLQSLSFQSIDTEFGALRGHTFHYSKCSVERIPTFKARRKSDGAEGEAIYQDRNLWASYIHFYLPSCPAMAERVFRAPTTKASSRSARAIDPGFTRPQK
jgi:cobyrinic acid a,c-diamide synthase